MATAKPGWPSAELRLLLKATGKFGTHAFHDGGHRVGIHADQQQTKLIATEPGDEVVSADFGGQNVSGDFQGPVSRGMAELIVEPLETVEIDHRQAERDARAAHCGPTHVQGFRPSSAIAQPGERVGQGKSQQGVAGLHLVAAFAPQSDDLHEQAASQLDFAVRAVHGQTEVGRRLMPRRG